MFIIIQTFNAEGKRKIQIVPFKAGEPSSMLELTDMHKSIQDGENVEEQLINFDFLNTDNNEN